MAQSSRSLRLTEAYRRRLLWIGERAEALARHTWPSIEALDATDWPERTAASLTTAQRQAVRLSGGYLSAYARSEGATGTAPAIDSARYSGVSRDGRSLAEALQSPIIGVRAALKEGREPSAALRLGLVRGLRTVGFEAVQAGRDALLDTVEADDRFTKWERAVAGTCGACMALSGTSGDDFEVHPGCQCTPQPVVRGTTDRFPLPSGAVLFAALSAAEQTAAVGAEAAELVREGAADLQDFVGHSRLDSDTPNFITQKPAEAVQAST